MTVRILPPSEWHRLNGQSISELLPFVRPADVVIIAAEDDDRIVALWAVARLVHFEGAWIDADYRRRPKMIADVMRRAYEVAGHWTDRVVLTAATSDDVRAIIESHLNGVKVPMDSYIVPISGERVCRFLH